MIRFIMSLLVTSRQRIQTLGAPELWLSKQKVQTVLNSDDSALNLAELLQFGSVSMIWAYKFCVVGRIC